VTPEAQQSLDDLRRKLRRASLAQVGGFRPEGPASSWFGRCMAHPGEGLPEWKGKPMFPLLQIRVNELPFKPKELDGIELLTLFHNQDEHPFDEPHGNGWLIREYRSVAGLVELRPPASPVALKPSPVRWTLIDDDAPGWEDAGGVIALKPLIADEEANKVFHEEFNRYWGTKVGGYPYQIQHGANADDFVFQVGSEEKVPWMWADNGIGYFYKPPSGEWRWTCQFY
jgi:hypothetical protein